MNLLKKTGLFVVFGIACLSILSISTVNVKAAEKVGNGVYDINTYIPYDDSSSTEDNNSAKETDSFSKVDLTGNGKNDTLVAIVKDDKLTLNLNGKKLKSWNNRPSVQVIKLSNKKAYLEITDENFKSNTTSMVLYKVKNGKLSKVIDYKTLLNKKLLQGNKYITTGYAFDMIYATKVKKNTIYLHASLGTKSLGQIKIDNLQLKYSGGKFKLKKNAGTIAATVLTDKGPIYTFTAAKKIQTYKAAGSKKKGIKIAKNKQFTLKKAAVVGKKLYVQVKTKSGKTGWIKLSTSKKPIVKVPGMLVWG